MSNNELVQYFEGRRTCYGGGKLPKPIRDGERLHAPASAAVRARTGSAQTARTISVRSHLRRLYLVAIWPMRPYS